MLATNKTDLASIVLRVALGAMLLCHGLVKFFVFTPHGTASYFSLLGLPSSIGYIVMIFEIIAGLCLLVGFLTRIMSLVVIIQMLCVISVHFNNGFIFTSQGGGWEYPAFTAMTALALVMLGGGRYSIPICHKKLGKY